MKDSIVIFRLYQARGLAGLSKCVRRGVGCVVTTPDNIVLSEGYNGWLRNALGDTCGSQGKCSREGLNSGESPGVGCVHAEQNAIINASRNGVSLVNSYLFCDTLPCEMCAKMIVQAGVSKVYVVAGSYPNPAGVNLLAKSGVPVYEVSLEAKH
jgi:dCMP deaminase